MRKMGLLDLCSNQSECPKDSVETVSSRRMFIPVWWSLGKRRRRKDSDGEPSQGGHRGPDSFHNHTRPRNRPSPDPQITVTSEISFRLFLSFQVLLGSSAHMLLISPFQSSLLHFKSEGILFIASEFEGEEIAEVSRPFTIEHR